MALKKKSSGGGGGADWMGTYGDMITLLLCFFVLLYSMSTISEENWKALVMSFNPDAEVTLHEAPGGGGPNSDSDEGEGGPLAAAALTQEDIDDEMEELFLALKNFAEQQASQSDSKSDKDNKDISVTKGAGKVFITFNNTVFFDGESSELRPESGPVLDSVSEMISSVSRSIDEVRVLGHTAQGNPNRPNNPKTDRLLSAQRSANVVAYVQEHSILDPAKLVSEGLGQWQPVASNATSEGRAQNRRVEMVISGRDLAKEENVQTYSTTEYFTTSENGPQSD